MRLHLLGAANVQPELCTAIRQKGVSTQDRMGANLRAQYVCLQRDDVRTRAGLGRHPTVAPPVYLVFHVFQGMLTGLVRQARR